MAAANLYIATQGRVAADATAILPRSDGTVEISGLAGVIQEPLARSAAVVRLESAFLTAPADVIGSVPAVENVRNTCASKLGPSFFDKAGPCFYPPEQDVADLTVKLLEQMMPSITCRESVGIRRPTERPAEPAPELVPYRPEEPVEDPQPSSQPQRPAPAKRAAVDPQIAACRAELEALKERVAEKVAAAVKVKNKMVRKRLDGSISTLNLQIQEKSAQLGVLEEVGL